MEKDNFIADVTGKKVLKVYPRGKWIFYETQRGLSPSIEPGNGGRPFIL